MEDIVIARVMIKYAAQMTDKKREEIACWLEKQAEDLRKEGKNYSKHFTARFLQETKQWKKEVKNERNTRE